MSKPTITVVGGTGNQGRAICNSFVKSGRWNVRALTRDPAGANAQALARAGVQLVQGNWESEADLVRAFTGSFAVYGLSVPPWQMHYPNTLSEFDSGRLQADAAKRAGVQLFLWSTLPAVGKDYLQMGGVKLHDDKAKVDEYIKSIGLPAIFISLCAFVESLVDWPLFKFSADGQSLEGWNYTIGKDTPVSFIWVERDLGPAVLALTHSILDSGVPLAQHPLNHTVQPIGSFRASWGDVFRTLGKYSGIPVTHTVVPTVDQRWNADLTKGFIYQDKHGLYPGVELPTPTVKSLGVKAGTLDEYIRGRVVPRLRAQ